MTLLIGKKQRQRSRSNLGFTFIELVLVILIVLVLTGLSSPLFSRAYAAMELDVASHRIAQKIEFAREMAIRERVAYKVCFNFEKRTSWIEKRSISDSPEFAKIKARVQDRSPLSPNLKISGTKTEIVLKPDGTSDNVQLLMQNKKGKGLVIEIVEAGGLVKIYDDKESL
jgi:Tfp pilus assembly protein FimT